MEKKIRLLCSVIFAFALLCTLSLFDKETVKADDHQFTIDRNDALLRYSGTGGIIEINGHEGDCANLFDAGRRPVEEFTSVFPEGNGFVYEIREVIRCLSEGKLTSDVMTPDATIGCCKLYDQILRKRA